MVRFLFFAVVLAIAPRAHAADCGAANPAGLAASVKAWHLLHLKLQSVTGGFGFSQESASEGGTGDYAKFAADERMSGKFGINFEYSPCQLKEADLDAAFERYYGEVMYIAKTFPGVGEGNLIQFPTCAAPFGANEARNTVVKLLGEIHPSEDDVQRFRQGFPTDPTLWEKIYRPTIDHFVLPDCAEWIAPSIVALWYAAHALTIVDMHGVSRFPGWDKGAKVREVAKVVRATLPAQFRELVFRVNEGKELCRPEH
jgi:hypothetical protein